MTFSVVQLFGGCRSRVRVPMQYACNRAGCVESEGEGSTGPSRGEHRLTVYRAHASRDFHEMTRRAFSVITVFIISNSVEERVDVCSTTPPSRDLEIENFIFFSPVQKIHKNPTDFNHFFFV